MANSITMGAPTPDQHGPSTGGDPTHMPDGTIVQNSSLGPLPTGPLGTYKQSPIPAQAGSQMISPPEAPGFNGFQLQGAPGSGIGQGHYAGLKDTSYPDGSVPSPDYPGQAGASNMEAQGDPLDWNTVGKYRYPEFPMSQAKQKMASGIQGAAPLT